MAQSFRESHRVEQELSTGISNFWGYSVRHQTIDYKSSKKQQSKPILARINVMNLKEEPPKTSRILQVEQ